MKLNKTETMWVVVNGDDNVVVDTIAYYRKDCIEAMIHLGGKDWQYWKKQGYSCLKVLVTISRKEEVK